MELEGKKELLLKRLSIHLKTLGLDHTSTRKILKDLEVVEIELDKNKDDKDDEDCYECGCFKCECWDYN